MIIILCRRRELAMVDADVEAFRSSLANLLLNAIKISVRPNVPILLEARL